MPQTARTASGQAAPWVRALGRTLSGIVVLAALILAWFIYKVYYNNPRTDDAYVHANTASSPLTSVGRSSGCRSMTIKG